MGLGKTLTMIALTATDLESHRDVAQYNMYDDDVKQPVPATLIIVPQPCMYHIICVYCCSNYRGSIRNVGRANFKVV